MTVNLTRVDAALAVDRALNAIERRIFTERQLQGRMSGACPADWISQAEDVDHALAVTDPWWEQHGPAVTGAVEETSGLPRELAHALVSAALHACIAIGVVDVHTNAVIYVTTLAGRAALWACGYAECLGWAPEQDQ